MLVSSKEILAHASKNGYAVPAPDFTDSNSAKAFCEVAAELKKPMILGFAEHHLDLMGLEDAAAIGKFYAEKADAPICLHFDHGYTFELIEKAIKCGATSVMIDASAFDYEENVKRTKAVVELAHANGVYTEAEIGHVGTEDTAASESIHSMMATYYTEPDVLARFVKDTGVDSVAVSIGTSHGKYKGTPVIAFDRLAELRAAVDVPLVLHGGSGSGDDNLSRCAREGISKVNLYTDFISAAIEAAQANLPDNWIKLQKQGSEAMKEVLRHYYKVFNCI